MQWLIICVVLIAVLTILVNKFGVLKTIVVLFAGIVAGHLGGGYLATLTCSSSGAGVFCIFVYVIYFPVLVSLLCALLFSILPRFPRLHEVRDRYFAPRPVHKKKRA